MKMKLKKTYKRISEFINRNEKRISYLSLFICFILAIISISLAAEVLDTHKLVLEKQKVVDETKIIYHDSLSDEDIICIKNMFSELDKIFLLKILSITFTRDKSILPKSTLGINENNKITILFSNKTRWNYYVLFHELMHSYINLETDLEEEMVVKISENSLSAAYPDFTGSFNEDCSVKLNKKDSKEIDRMEIEKNKF